MRAIILAAGMGLRLRPLTDDKPKALVETAGESFFSRQLRLLHAIGVREICVVTGYKAEAFAPWIGQPGLDFVYNERYHDRNNLFSMLLVRERLAGSLVLEGDVWISESILPTEAPRNSTYFVGYRDGMNNEWAVRTDENDRLVDIVVRSGDDWILSGISYWNEADGKRLAGLIAEASTARGSENLFWDDIPRRNLESFDIRVRRIGSDDWAEIDNLEDRVKLEASLARSPSRL